MSWELFAAPLQTFAEPDRWQVLTRSGVARLPDEPPPPGPPLTVADLVAALRRADLPGYFSAVIAGDDSFALRAPDPLDVGFAWGLGHVNVHVEHKRLREVRDPDDAVVLIAFHKPDPASVLRAACEVATSTPLYVFGESMNGVVIYPGEGVDVIEPDWPW